MSEIDDNKLQTEVAEEPTKPLSKLWQYIIGLVYGALNAGAIMLSGRTSRPTSLKSFKKVGEGLMYYAFLIRFAVFMIGSRRLENAHGVRYKQLRIGYIISIAVFLVALLAINLISGKLSFGG